MLLSNWPKLKRTFVASFFVFAAFLLQKSMAHAAGPDEIEQLIDQAVANIDPEVPRGVDEATALLRGLSDSSIPSSPLLSKVIKFLYLPKGRDMVRGSHGTFSSLTGMHYGLTASDLISLREAAADVLVRNIESIRADASLQSEIIKAVSRNAGFMQIEYGPLRVLKALGAIRDQEVRLELSRAFSFPYDRAFIEGGSFNAGGYPQILERQLALLEIMISGDGNLSEDETSEIIDKMQVSFVNEFEGFPRYLEVLLKSRNLGPHMLGELEKFFWSHNFSPPSFRHSDFRMGGLFIAEILSNNGRGLGPEILQNLIRSIPRFGDPYRLLTETIHFLKSQELSPDLRRDLAAVRSRSNAVVRLGIDGLVRFYRLQRLKAYLDANPCLRILGRLF